MGGVNTLYHGAEGRATWGLALIFFFFFFFLQKWSPDSSQTPSYYLSRSLKDPPNVVEETEMQAMPGSHQSIHTASLEVRGEGGQTGAGVGRGA